jgi:hypothetical protein
MNKDIFKDIISLHDVAAVMLIGDNGRPLVSTVADRGSGLEAVRTQDWSILTQAFNGFKEAELVYENHRLFIKKAPSGFLVVFMGRFAPVAMVRLHCDVALARLAAPKTRFKGLAGLFRK